MNENCPVNYRIRLLSEGLAEGRNVGVAIVLLRLAKAAEAARSDLVEGGGAPGRRHGRSV